MTRQRQLIFDIIMQSCTHLTAEDIFVEAKKQMPSIALGTVYRNLGLMVQAGEIQQITLAGQPEHFDRIVPIHDHMVCRKCGAIIDVSFPRLAAYLSKNCGKPVDSYELNIVSICDDCKISDEKETQNTNK